MNIEISPRSFSLWRPCQAGEEGMQWAASFEPQECGVPGGEEGLKSQQVCVGGRDLCSSIRPPP